MSCYLFPAAAKTACEAVLGPNSIPLVDATGATTVYLSNYENAPAATDAAVVAAGGTVYASPALALAATSSRVAKADAVADAIKAKAQAALTANAAFLALASPTNAQTLAQVQLLTKEANALIRLALNQLDATTGT